LKEKEGREKGGGKEGNRREKGGEVKALSPSCPMVPFSTLLVGRQ